MSKLKDRLNKSKGLKNIFVPDNPFETPEEPEEEPKQEEVKPDYRDQSNPAILYNEVVKDPTPEGIFKEKVAEGYTLDMNALERYLIYDMSPKKFRTYMRYQKARTIEDVKGFSTKPKVKFSGKIIWILLGVGVMLVLGFIILSNPDALTNLFKGFMGG